mgnify:CR=1 FL=1
MTYEVDTDGRDVGLGVGVICEAQKQAGLAGTRVADKKELEEVVAVPHKGQTQAHTHHKRTNGRTPSREAALVSQRAHERTRQSHEAAATYYSAIARW